MTKTDVRVEIDRIDNAMLELLAERHGYVSRMAQLKQDPAEALDPERIESMIAKKRSYAEELHADPDQIEVLWRTLIGWNVDFEKNIIRARLKG